MDSIQNKTKFELVENRLEEVVKDYGNTSIKHLEEKYGASYATIQRVLKKHGYIQGLTAKITEYPTWYTAISSADLVCGEQIGLKMWE